MSDTEKVNGYEVTTTENGRYATATYGGWQVVKEGDPQDVKQWCEKH